MTVNEKYKKGISVIICTYNGEKRLSPTLSALKQQTGLDQIDWEVILVDNASKDNTKEVAREVWGNHHIPLRILHEPTPGRDSAIKTGLNNVTYEYIVNVDDDNWLVEHYLKTVFEILEQDKSIGILGGAGEAVYEEELPNELKPYEAALAVHIQLKEPEGYLTKRHYLYGAGFAIRKTYYDELFSKGFEFVLTGRAGKNLSSGEDQELGYAMKMLGYKLYFSNKLTFKHAISKQRVTLDYFKKLYKAFGRSEFVLDQYKYYGKLHESRMDYLKSRWYLIYLFHSLYSALKLYVSRSIVFSKEKKIKCILELQRKKALFLFTVSNFSFFLNLKRKLANAEWITDHV